MCHHAWHVLSRLSHDLPLTYIHLMRFQTLFVTQENPLVLDSTAWPDKNKDLFVTGFWAFLPSDHIAAGEMRKTHGWRWQEAHRFFCHMRLHSVWLQSLSRVGARHFDIPPARYSHTSTTCKLQGSNSQLHTDTTEKYPFFPIPYPI